MIRLKLFLERCELPEQRLTSDFLIKILMIHYGIT